MSSLTCEQTIREHIKFLGSRFSCDTSDGRAWVTSPYAFPDGDLLEVAVAELGGGQFRVTDLGETLRHLADLGFDPRLTSKGEYLVSESLKHHHAELDRGMITKTVSLPEVAAAIQDVLMACYSIAHLIFLARGSRPATFVEEVGHFLTEQDVKVEPRHREKGMSGTTYDFDYLVRGQHGDGLVVALSPAMMSGVTGMVNATFRKWSDVSNGRWHGTILDDRLINWRPNDITLLSDVSKVYRWKEREALLELLKRG